MKFGHVFSFLIALAIVSAFVIDPKYTNRVRSVQSIFTPVAAPTRRVAAAMHAKLGANETRDHRALADVRTENEQLRTELANLHGLLAEMKRINADRSQVGNLRDRCTPVAVDGSDTGTSESLILRSSPGDGVAADMPVIYASGLVGRVVRSAYGTQVRLVTDRSFKATARFGRYEKGEDGLLHLKLLGKEKAVVQGDGKGGLVVGGHPASDADQVKPGDELVLDDPDWPEGMKQIRLGQVASKSEQRGAQLFVVIQVRPNQNLKQLREVMVVTK
jgi:cell shape-determining protein MreC